MEKHRIIEEMISLKDEDQAAHLMKFFKTGKGQYGEGDKFLGIKVPQTRSVSKKYRDNITRQEIEEMLDSEWHEIRLLGFFLLIEVYNKAVKHDSNLEEIVEYYLSRIDRGNNWDLVDLVAPKILGHWLLNHPEKVYVLHELAEMDHSLWQQRVAIVATLPLIKAGRFEDTFLLAERYLTHKHDLIHKATGWMLREIGKAGGKTLLIDFLNKNVKRMPRTTFRYAIERFSDEDKRLLEC